MQWQIRQNADHRSEWKYETPNKKTNNCSGVHFVMSLTERMHLISSHRWLEGAQLYSYTSLERREVIWTAALITKYSYVVTSKWCQFGVLPSCLSFSPKSSFKEDDCAFIKIGSWKVMMIFVKYDNGLHDCVHSEASHGCADLSGLSSLILI